MIEDYVIEPSCFKTAESVRYLFEKFGFHQGRFLITYPIGWVSKVRLALASLPDMQRKRAIEFLGKYRDDRIVERSVSYDANLLWAENAAGAIRTGSVDKAICDERNTFGIKTYDEIDETFFSHGKSGRTLANTANYLIAVRRLFQISREVILVDPYFQFNRPGRSKVLGAFFNEAKTTLCKSFVLYCRHSLAANAGMDRFRETASMFCKKYLSGDQKLVVRLLDDEGRPNCMHARYIFSRKGGISFDKGFQEEPVETFVDLALLSPEMVSEQCRLYLEGEHGHTELQSFVWKDGRT